MKEEITMDKQQEIDQIIENINNNFLGYIKLSKFECSLIRGVLEELYKQQSTDGQIREEIDAIIEKLIKNGAR